MGPDSAALACNEFLNLKLVVPIHWGTFPFLIGDPQRFKSLVHRGQVLLPSPGAELTIEDGAVI
jgi:L-ascorbate metabolism protein UlaG (beta-lactamase superfamily)